MNSTLKSDIEVLPFVFISSGISFGLKGSTGGKGDIEVRASGRRRTCRLAAAPPGKVCVWGRRRGGEKDGGQDGGRKGGQEEKQHSVREV